MLRTLIIASAALTTACSGPGADKLAWVAKTENSVCNASHPGAGNVLRARHSCQSPDDTQPSKSG